MMRKADVFALGLGLLLAGALLVAVDGGNQGLPFLLAVVIGAAGGLLLQVAAIAWAVEIGTRPLRADEPAAPGRAIRRREGPAWPAWLAVGAAVLALGVLITAGLLAWGT